MSGFGGSSTRNDLLDFEKFPLYAETYREAFRTNPEERAHASSTRRKRSPR